MLDKVAIWIKQDNPNYFVLIMTSLELPGIVVEISSYKSMSYLNYATLVKMADENAWEKLERYRQQILMGD
jgi:hypothetical protein